MSQDEVNIQEVFQNINKILNPDPEPLPELLKCPFCGSSVYSGDYDDSSDYYHDRTPYIECVCGIRVEGDTANVSTGCRNIKRNPNVEKDVRVATIKLIHYWNRRV